MQSLVVALIVMACSLYAAWTLMPSALRRTLALWMLKLALPEWLARPFRRAAGPAGACGGCDSCGDTASKPAATGAQKVTFHRRIS